MKTGNRYLVVIPTYNEKENITKIIPEVLTQNPRIDILVVDDNSPDGTGGLVQEISRKNSRVFVLHRKRKMGLGTAYRDGFRWGLGHGYDFLISMDADFSHPPQALRDMIKLSQKCATDIILASRYVGGGRIIGWDIKRYLNSYFANFVTRLILRLRPKDTTSGFKLYPAAFIRSIDFRELTASGYAFQVEMIYWAQKNGYGGCEIPITFCDRRAGQSKISGEIMKSAKIVFKLFLEQTWVKQFIKFCFVGVTCAAIDWSIFYLIKYLFGWDAQSLKQLAKAISFVVSVIASYILNRTWTFRSQNKEIFAQAIKFFSMATVGLGLNNLFFYIITARFKLPDYAGLLIATFIVLFWNFSVSRLWVFRRENGTIVSNNKK